MKNKTTNALAMASYRAGCELDYVAKIIQKDELTKEEKEIILEKEHFDYTKKKEVKHSKIILPKNCPKEYSDRNILWNTIESIESKIPKGRRAKEVEVSLPNEFDLDTCIAVIENFVNTNFVSKGFIVDYSIHWKEEIDKKTGEKKINHHAHILVPTRMISDKGDFIQFKSKKVYNYELDAKGNKIQQKDPITKKPLWKTTIKKETNEEILEPEYRVPLIDKNTGKQKVDDRNRKQWKTHKEEFNEFNKPKFLIDLRKGWANECNKYLSEENKISEKSHKARITGMDYVRDERGYKIKGEDGNYIKEPIKLREDEKLPEGILPLEYVSRIDKQKEKRGVITEATQRNIDIKKHNGFIYQLLEQIKEIKDKAIEVIEEFIKPQKEENVVPQKPKKQPPQNEQKQKIITLQDIKNMDLEDVDKRIKLLSENYFINHFMKRDFEEIKRMSSSDIHKKYAIDVFIDKAINTQNSMKIAQVNEERKQIRKDDYTL